ncbi:MAG: hypothetical protein QOI83_2536 [Streptomycetaceae bacterium]|nr:hypothetical protein [Streptomycetaceae bacterium]
MGWYGGSCGYCEACREGDAINCPQLQIPGVAYPGGHADAVVVPVIALARIPDGLIATDPAFEKLLSGAARFRMVLTTGN